MPERTFGQEAVRHCRYCDVNTFAYLVNISLRYRYWYTETPQAGEGALKLMLQRAEFLDPDYQPPRGPSSVHDRTRSPLLGPQHVGAYENYLKRDDIHKFCWARNPYTRLVSAYLRMIRAPAPRNRIIRVLRDLGQPPAPKTPPSFEDFILAIEHQSVFDMDINHKPQHCLTQPDRIPYHFIGRFEHFERDCQTLAQDLKLDYPRYAKNLAPYYAETEAPPETHYTPALRKRVAKLYEADFDYFKYPVAT